MIGVEWSPNYPTNQSWLVHDWHCCGKYKYCLFMDYFDIDSNWNRTLDDTLSILMIKLRMIEGTTTCIRPWLIGLLQRKWLRKIIYIFFYEERRLNLYETISASKYGLMKNQHAFNPSILDYMIWSVNLFPATMVIFAVYSSPMSCLIGYNIYMYIYIYVYIYIHNSIFACTIIS